MPSKGNYYVYIITNRKLVLYIGVTNDLRKRIAQHRESTFPGFSRKYKIDRLVYYELFHSIEDAITREKQLKGWRREKKIKLIEITNPNWKDLYIATL